MHSLIALERAPVKISILLPNLNTRPFLEERLESILAQTFQDWEIVVVDGHSTDGAWELLQAYARKEPRMRLSQSPARGIYAAWNECIEKAAGEYIYFATSDDTMTPDCLEKLAAALDTHPECGLTHCCLTFIDERSRPVTGRWVWHACAPYLFYGDLIRQRHVRAPGYDTVLAFALGTPYQSMTQLLIRRSLFARTGLFETRWGSFADLEWQMRATLVTSTVHVPEYLATWRIHAGQATQGDPYSAAIRRGWMLEMLDSVLAYSRREALPAPVGLPRRLRRFFVAEQFYQRCHILRSRLAKFTLFLATAVREPAFGLFLWKDHQTHSQSGNHMRDIREELERLHLPPPVLEATPHPSPALKACRQD